MKKSYIAAALVLTSTMVMGAAAVSQSRNVTATFRPDITLKVNGTAYTVRDTTGAQVSPLIYNGTTYLPLSSLGQLLDVNVSWDAATNTVNISDAATASAYIGEAKAKEIALNHAGLTAGQVTFLQLKLDWENGRQVYEVEFYSSNKEYDYEIDASTGSIVGYDYDIENYTIPSTGASTTTGLIGEAKAKEIALNHAGLTSSQVSFVLAKLDWENGRQVYEVEFYSGNKEYDYEIDASTGAIRSYDYDIENYTIPSTGASTGASASTGLIGEAKAKEIALNHAGLTSSQVSFVQTKLDWENGRQVYEVEFYSGNKEYDYEIDAASGAIRGYDFDIENYTIPSTSTSASNGSYISREKAQQLAQAKAPGATLIKLELDYDDGRAVYEGELRDGRTEYEFEIDASTGSFIKWSQDWD